VKEDLESSSQVKARVNEGYTYLEKNGSHLVFCHAGVVATAFDQLGIKDFMIDNCGIVSFNIDQNGVPTELLGFWDPPIMSE
jgi:broad specificity phosphatase PhoE